MLHGGSVVTGSRQREWALSDDRRITITDRLAIPESELAFRASRSGGPGGQHVNTSSTRIELIWDVAGSPSITDEQRIVLLDRLGRRIDSRGVLHLFSSGSRSQYQNREAVLKRFRTLIAAALKRRRKRKKTVPPPAAREERLRAKKRRSETKRRRARPSPDD